MHVGDSRCIKKEKSQVSLYENPICFAMGALLDPQNRWIKLSGMIPWDQIEEKYSLNFDNPIKGKPAKSCRMVIGSLIIKEMCRLSDEDTVAMITENPYQQFYIGLSAFTNKEPLMHPRLHSFASACYISSLTVNAGLFLTSGGVRLNFTPAVTSLSHSANKDFCVNG